MILADEIFIGQVTREIRRRQEVENLNLRTCLFGSQTLCHYGDVSLSHHIFRERGNEAKSPCSSVDVFLGTGYPSSYVLSSFQGVRERNVVHGLSSEFGNGWELLSRRSAPFCLQITSNRHESIFCNWLLCRARN